MEERKLLPSRANRGSKLASLIQGETPLLEEDPEVAEIFADEEDDAEFEYSSEESDFLDDDFDQPVDIDEEQNEDLDQQILIQERIEKNKNKKGYRDPALGKGKTGGKVKRQDYSREATGESGGDKDGGENDNMSAASNGSNANIASDRRLRTTTVTMTQEIEKKREKRQLDEEKRKMDRAKKPKKAEVILTQEQLLEEAKITEQQNIESLNILLQWEADIKKQAKEARRVRFDGPVVTYHSTLKKPNYEIHTEETQHKSELLDEPINTITFSDDIPKVFLPYPHTNRSRACCAVTGLPAQYKDPLTGLPYHDLEAFHKIRQHYYTVPNQPIQ